MFEFSTNDGLTDKHVTEVGVHTSLSCVDRLSSINIYFFPVHFEVSLSGLGQYLRRLRNYDISLS